MPAGVFKDAFPLLLSLILQTAVASQCGQGGAALAMHLGWQVPGTQMPTNSHVDYGLPPG